MNNYPNYKKAHHHHHQHLLLFFFFVLVLTITPVKGDAEQQQQDPSPLERGMGLTEINSHWDTIRAWVKLAWINLRPPDYEFGQSGTVHVKQAATKSFETSKQTVEQAAASAAKMAGMAVEKTKEKVKNTMSTGSRDSDAEL